MSVSRPSWSVTRLPHDLEGEAVEPAAGPPPDLGMNGHSQLPGVDARHEAGIGAEILAQIGVGQDIDQVAAVVAEVAEQGEPGEGVRLLPVSGGDRLRVVGP